MRSCRHGHHRGRRGNAARAARLLLALAAALLAGAAAAQCAMGPEATQLTVEGFGTALFHEFSSDPGRSRALLYGGVCITSPQGSWTITADEVLISGLRQGERLQVRVAEATVVVPGWTLRTAELTSEGETLELAGTRFSGGGVTGTAERLTIDLADGTVRLGGIEALGPSYRIFGQSATLTGNSLRVDDAAVTTCTCPGPPFYQVVGERVVLDLEKQELVVEDGQLELGRVRVELGERLELSSTAPQPIAPPFSIEYVGHDANGRGGTGLGVNVPHLGVGEGAWLEFGLTGLDPAFPLGAHALLHYQQAGVRAVVGRARGGPRAEFSVQRPVSHWLDATVAIANRHEPASDYLHEGSLQLATRLPPLTLPGRERLTAQLSGTAAASSQALPAGAITYPRLRLAGSATLEAPASALGNLRLAADAEVTAYPGHGHQYGVRLRPRWQLAVEPARFTLEYDRRWTNAGSPFTTRLDRLTEINRLRGAVTVTGPVGDARGQLEAVAEYDLLPATNAPHQGLDRLRLAGHLETGVEGWTVRPRVELELAGVVDPRPGKDRLAHFEAGVDLKRDQFEFGFDARYRLHPGREGLERLRASVAFPLDIGDVELVPYLALDAAPLLTHGHLPRLAGHGLELTWGTCCGAVMLGYRQQDESFTTSFGLAFER